MILKADEIKSFLSHDNLLIFEKLCVSFYSFFAYRNLPNMRNGNFIWLFYSSLHQDSIVTIRMRGKNSLHVYKLQIDIANDIDKIGV